jgi:hypothetical protein
LINAGYLVADTLTSKRRAAFFRKNPAWDRAGNWLGWLLTFHLILIAEVFFRAQHVSDAVWLLGHLFNGLAGSLAALDGLLAGNGMRGLLIGLAGHLILELGERYRPDQWLRKLYVSAPRWLQWSYCSAGVTFAIFGLALFFVHTAGKRAAFLYEIF